jgi:hypothetical protein
MRENHSKLWRLAVNSVTNSRVSRVASVWQRNEYLCVIEWKVTRTEVSDPRHGSLKRRQGTRSPPL